MKRWMKYFFRGATRRRRTPSAPPEEVAADPLAEEIRLLQNDAIFDSGYYLENYPDIAAAGVDPLRHFCEFGWREGRDPGMFFSVAYYLDRNQDVREAGVNPLLHYVCDGEKEGRSPSPLFSLTFIGLQLDQKNPRTILSNFQTRRLALKLSCHPIIDLDWVERQCPDGDHRRDPLKWYLTLGWRAGVPPSGFLDPLAKSRLASGAATAPNANAFFLHAMAAMSATGIPTREGQTILPDMHCLVVDDTPLPRQTTLSPLAVFVFTNSEAERRTGLLNHLASLELDLKLQIISDDKGLILPPGLLATRLWSTKSEEVFEIFLGAREKATWLILDNRSGGESAQTAYDRRSDWHNLIGTTRMVYEAIAFQSRFPNKCKLIPLDASEAKIPRQLTRSPWLDFSGYYKVGPAIVSRLEEEFLQNTRTASSGNTLATVERMFAALPDNPEHEICYLRSQIPFRFSTVFGPLRPYLSHKDIPSYLEHSRARAPTRICIYTAIIGSYDSLKAPEIVEPGVDYICFSDGPLFSHPIWQLRSIRYYHPDPTRMARYVKLNPHKMLPEYDLCLWVDANILLRRPVLPLLAEFRDDFSMLFVKHPKRDCVYEEQVACKALTTDDSALIDRQIKRYHNLGLPEHIGLIESNFFAVNTRHPDSIAFFSAWWKELENETRRDQLAYAFAKFTTGIEPEYLFQGMDSTRNHPAFALFPHGNSETGYLEDPAVFEHLGLIAPCGAGLTSTQVPADGDKNPTPQRPAATVVICVHNSRKVVQECIGSVLSSLATTDQLIIVDDASTDQELVEYLTHLSSDNPDRISLLRRAKNIGYTRSANLGLQAATTDIVVLLNSDTQVPGDWLTKITVALHCHPGVGVAGPMSNAASYQSLPDIRGTENQTAVNDLPDGHDLTTLNRLCENLAKEVALHPVVPLIHGFCIAVKQDVFARIGYFDEEYFPFGYGEENDFCIRASQAGFDLVLANDLFVYHHKSQSFSDPKRRRGLMQDGAVALAQKHGQEQVAQRVKTMKSHSCLQRMRRRFAEECDKPSVN